MKIVNILLILYVIFFFLGAPLLLSVWFTRSWNLFYGWIIGSIILTIYYFLGKYTPLPSLNTVLDWPRTLIKKSVFGTLRFITTILYNDTFVGETKEVSRLFEEVWGPTLEAQGFESYGYRVYKGNLKAIPRYYYIKDTHKGYFHLVCYSQFLPDQIHVDAFVVPYGNIIRNTPHTKYIDFCASFEKNYLNIYFTFGERSIKEHFRQALSDFMSDDYFQQFSDISKPFDTIRPKDILNDITLASSLVNSNPLYLGTKLHCLSVYEGVAKDLKDEQLLQESKEALQELRKEMK